MGKRNPFWVTSHRERGRDLHTWHCRLCPRRKGGYLTQSEANLKAKSHFRFSHR